MARFNRTLEKSSAKGEKKQSLSNYCENSIKLDLICLNIKEFRCKKVRVLEAEHTALETQA